MSNLKNTLNEVKSNDWSVALLSFFVIHRHRKPNRKFDYDVLKVGASEKLAKKLRKIVSSRIKKSNIARPYDYITSDQDDDLLSINIDQTDFNLISLLIKSSKDAAEVQQENDLVGAWIYVAELQLPDTPTLMAVRLVSKDWTRAKLEKSFSSFIFQHQKMVDLDDVKIFQIDSHIDFFAFNGSLFIAHKKNFERAMNFRKGMEKNRDQIVDEFTNLKIFDDPKEISRLVGDHVPRLRKLSQIKNAGYFRDPKFMADLQIINEKDKWGIKYDDNGCIVVTEENLDTVLKVLNNDRLTSKINSENFDVDVKHKLGAKV